MSQIAFDGWSASAMVRTAVYRDGQEVDKKEVDEPGTAQQPVGDEGTRAEAGTHETIASAAAMAALRASFEEFNPGDVDDDDDASDDGSGPIARLSGVPTVPAVRTVPTVPAVPTVPSPAVGSRAAVAAASTPSPPSPLHLDWNFDAPFAENVAASSPATRSPLDASAASVLTGFDHRASSAASASSTRQRRAGEGLHRAGRDSTGAARVVGGLESRYREVMGRLRHSRGACRRRRRRRRRARRSGVRPRRARAAGGGGVAGDVRVTRGEGRSGRVETHFFSLDVALRTERRVKVFGLGKRGDTSRQGERSRSFSKMTFLSSSWKNLYVVRS